MPRKKIEKTKEEKPKEEKVEKVKAESPKPAKKERYYEAVGRRKTASARVRLTVSSNETVVVNKVTLQQYFKDANLEKNVVAPFAALKLPEKFSVTAQVYGGGKSGQAEAIRHGIARALLLYVPESRKKLKRPGYLKRDPRSKERRKFGLKKARKSPQWAKR
jgi:small subunit ribosomal protein S9